MQASPLDEFIVPAVVPDHPGFRTEVHLVVGAHGSVYIRLSQENEDNSGMEAVVMSVAKFLQLAETLKQRH